MNRREPYKNNVVDKRLVKNKRKKKESDKLVARKKPAKIFIFLAKRKEEKK